MNDDKELLNIQLRVADMQLPMTVKRSEESYYRIAAEKIDKLLNLYRGSYKKQDDGQYMIMVALHLSVALVKQEKQNDTRPYKEKIDELTRMLEDYLKKDAE